MPGTISVLNAGAGDMKFNFNSEDPLEAARAQRCVEDMLRRGYMLFVEVEGKLHRIEDFDPKHGEYIVADGPGDRHPICTPNNEPVSGKVDPFEEKAKLLSELPKQGSRKGRRVPAKAGRAIAVPKTAGG